MLGYCKEKENQFTVTCPISDVVYAAIWEEEPSVISIFHSDYFKYGKGGKKNGTLQIKPERREFFRHSVDREDTSSSHSGASLDDFEYSMEHAKIVENYQDGAEEFPDLEDLEIESTNNGNSNDFIPDTHGVQKSGHWEPPTESSLGEKSSSSEKIVLQIPKASKKSSKIQSPSIETNTRTDECRGSSNPIETSSRLLTEPTGLNTENGKSNEETDDIPNNPNDPNEENSYHSDESRGLFDDELTHKEPVEEPIEEEQPFKIEIFEKKIEISTIRGDKKQIPLLSRIEADRKGLFRCETTTMAGRKNEWSKLLPKFNLSDPCSDRKDFWDNFDLFFVRMEDVFNDQQIRDLPIHWEKITNGSKFPENFAYCLFDASKNIFPFTGKI